MVVGEPSLSKNNCLVYITPPDDALKKPTSVKFPLASFSANSLTLINSQESKSGPETKSSDIPPLLLVLLPNCEPKAVSLTSGGVLSVPTPHHEASPSMSLTLPMPFRPALVIKLGNSSLRLINPVLA